MIEDASAMSDVSQRVTKLFRMRERGYLLEAELYVALADMLAGANASSVWDVIPEVEKPVFRAFILGFDVKRDRIAGVASKTYLKHIKTFQSFLGT